MKSETWMGDWEKKLPPTEIKGSLGALGGGWRCPKPKDFSVVVTSEADQTYFGCAHWRALTNVHGVESGRMCLFYFDHYNNDIGMFYEVSIRDSSEFTEDGGQDPEMMTTSLYIRKRIRRKTSSC